MESAQPQEPGTTRTLLVERDAGGSVVSTVRRSVLPGGLRVVTEQMSGVRSATIGVWVAVGSRDESADLSGASHFLEHLLFKGTPERSALDISAALDAVGGEFNAFTSREYTCFYARVLDVDVPLAVDVLGDMVTSSCLRPEDVEGERAVILDEIAMHDDDPEELAGNRFASLSWPSSPLGRPVAGTAASVAAVGRDDIERFYRSGYRAENTIVSVAGNVDHDSVVRLVGPSFTRSGFLEDAARVPLGPRTSGSAGSVAAGSAYVEKPFEQVNLLLGVDGLRRTDERRYALALLNAAVGGGPSSRLFQEVRERRGLAYSVYSYASHYSDTGAFCVAAGCLPGRLDDVLVVVREVLAGVAEDGISEDELRLGQGQLTGGLVLGLEDSASRMSRIAKAELLYDELPGIDEVLGRIRAVGLEDVRDLAHTVLGRPQSLVIVGPRR